ncbi:hydrogenase subunit MbhD domain-containing protein [Paracoccus hibiscisoli]|uniref:hydrogenase subunit MbhD domain-containing protein n=1 Tax=Paracoccus hibiscisoli TaxID=2023261 RepID=UPI0023F1F701|nr:hydrogenase subunit MbhD domain-containing protein [Paracoccus hibiscisoli]
MTAAFDIILCFMIFGTAGIALFVRDALAAIAFFIAFGNLMGLAWLGLDAVNVALAEIAIGAGVTGVLLILARARLLALGDNAICSGTPRWLWLGAFAACTGLALLLTATVLSITPESGLDRVVAPLMPGLGIKNRVTGVLLAFRAYDTLLESFVLLGALVAVWSLAPPGGWPGRPADVGMADAPMRRVAGAFGQLLLPVALVMAAYLVWAGSDLPGGAFQAGTVLAGGLMVAAMGGVMGLPRSDHPLLRPVLVLGPLVFLVIGLAGVAAGGLLVFPEGMAKAAIVTIEYTLFLSIGVTLALLVVGPPVVGAGALDADGKG